MKPVTPCRCLQCKQFEGMDLRKDYEKLWGIPPVPVLSARPSLKESPMKSAQQHVVMIDLIRATGEYGLNPDQMESGRF